MPELNKAENAFFESGGQTVDKSLSEGLAAKPVDDKPVADVPRGTSDDKSSEQLELTPSSAEEKTETKTPEEIAKANKDASDARKKLLSDLGAVPLEALQEAREEGKLTKRQLAELQQWKQQIDPLLTQLKPVQKPTEPNPYDPNVQPAEHKAYQEWIDTKQAVKETAEWRANQERQAQANAQTAQIMNWAQNQERSYKATNPVYDDAYKFATESRHEELKALGYSDPATRQQIIENDQAQIIMEAARKTSQGTPTNPAELIYNYANAKGFKGKADPSIAAAAKIQAGQQAAGGLKGGATPKGTVSLEEVAAIDTSTPAGRKKYDEMWAKAIG